MIFIRYGQRIGQLIQTSNFTKLDIYVCISCPKEGENHVNSGCACAMVRSVVHAQWSDPLDPPQELFRKCGIFVCLMVFNATFNNISVILWRSVLFVFILLQDWFTKCMS
jgi:hypothetical protein